MYFFSLPNGKSHEDTSESLVLLARFFLLFAVFSLGWGVIRIPVWINSFSCRASVTGTLIENVVQAGSMNKSSSYEYSVGGQNFHYDVGEFMDRPIGHLPPPGPVKVFYDAANPGRSVLHRTPSPNLFVGLITAVGTFLLARMFWKMAAG